MAGIASEHIPSSTDPATISASDVPASATASSAAPAAARTNPVIMGGLGPRRAVSGPLAVEPTPTATLIGKISRPVLSADSCRACCKNSDRQISVP